MCIRHEHDHEHEPKCDNVRSAPEGVFKKETRFGFPHLAMVVESCCIVRLKEMYLKTLSQAKKMFTANTLF